MGTSTKHCLVEKCLPSVGKKEPTFALFAKNVVSRPVGELHFICSNTELQEGVSFGEGLPTFDLCTEVQNDCGPDFFCFNSDTQDLGDDVAENIIESESEGLGTQRSDIDGEQTPIQLESDDGQQPVVNDDDSESQKSESSESESESLPPLRTRRGRAIRKPRKFGFDD